MEEKLLGGGEGGVGGGGPVSIGTGRSVGSSVGYERVVGKQGRGGLAAAGLRAAGLVGLGPRLGGAARARAAAGRPPPRPPPQAALQRARASAVVGARDAAGSGPGPPGPRALRQRTPVLGAPLGLLGFRDSALPPPLLRRPLGRHLLLLSGRLLLFHFRTGRRTSGQYRK